ncbi:alpha-helical ferredoxin [Lucifera butyrica]|uniref:Alpha-helical ferredoxin n=1 Tax=Lucifera butyrica TaxID=1351585 RepID=A0A498RA34_9FIRM|nr:anaerobic sulfite reductase subunit AsrA [Lucifera butyrica]VBB06993.1 alpha-helical ferredoxin [Lucifera butyrica]
MGEGYRLTLPAWQEYFEGLQKEFDIWAPVVCSGKGAYTGTDSVRYKPVHSFTEIAYDRKSDFSARETLLPITQTLFYFTEDNWTEPKVRDRKILLFLRSCDIHALRRLDQIYLENGPADPYYKAVRDQVSICLIECRQSFANCFCASLNTNRTENYDLFVRPDGDFVDVQIKNSAFPALQGCTAEIEPRFVTDNAVRVTMPANLPDHVFEVAFWQEYSSRCIGCGRCNFVCPTCTCFSMQDIFYKDNEKSGERRRVWASCMVDGFTDMAGGHSFRQSYGERMRFRVLHKVYDYKKRFGESMCVGCGRCDDVCPEYISFSHAINRLQPKEGE